MHDADRMGRGAGLAVLRELLVLRRVPPAEALLFGVELDDHCASVGPFALEDRDVVVIGDEATAVVLEDREEPLFVDAVAIRIVDPEVSDEVDGQGVVLPVEVPLR